MIINNSLNIKVNLQKKKKRKKDLDVPSPQGSYIGKKLNNHLLG